MSIFSYLGVKQKLIKHLHPMPTKQFEHFSQELFKILLSPLGEVRTNFEAVGEPQFISVFFVPSNQSQTYLELEGRSQQSQTLNDEFSQGLLGSALSGFGRVYTNYEIPVEPICVDIWFSPSKNSAINYELGIVSKIAKTNCVIVPFEDEPTTEDIYDSFNKLFRLQNDIRRVIKLEQKHISDDELENMMPRLWIICPSVSKEILDGFTINRNESWPEGVYFAARSFLTTVIAINELPNTPETLWLRILGEGEIQKLAVNQVISLSQEHPHRDSILELLAKSK